MMHLNGKRVTVLGLGISGVAAVKLLAREGAIVSAVDRREASQLSGSLEALSGVAVDFHLGGHDVSAVTGADLLVLSPGIQPDLPIVCTAQETGVPIMGELELGYGFLDVPIYAVTGTNGKSTTTSLLAEIFQAQGKKVFVGGNLGTPLCEAVLSGTDWDLAVVEVSSFQLEQTEAFKPHVAALLNFSPDHMDRYTQLSDYRAAKWRIFENQTEDDVAILNAADPLAQNHSALLARRYLFSRMGSVERGLGVSGGHLIFYDRQSEQIICGVAEIGMQGVHQLENALAAALMALLGGCDTASVSQGLKSFSGLEHRMEFVEKVDGISFFNDSKGTNVAAGCMSLKSFSEPVVLIAGGKDKGGDFLPLKEAVKGRAKRIILMGEAREKLSATLGNKIPIDFVDTMEQAVQAAFEAADSGDAVLLSPACASFDQFRDFEHRGETFKEAVRCLKSQGGRAGSCSSAPSPSSYSA